MQRSVTAEEDSEMDRTEEGKKEVVVHSHRTCSCDVREK